MKNCIYCKKRIDDEFVVDVCESCGHKVWGEKMFRTIVENMSKAKDVGNLYQGSVTQSFNSVKAK
mgnify:FL=1